MAPPFFFDEPFFFFPFLLLFDPLLVVVLGREELFLSTCLDIIPCSDKTVIVMSNFDDSFCNNVESEEGGCCVVEELFVSLIIAVGLFEAFVLSSSVGSLLSLVDDEVLLPIVLLHNVVIFVVIGDENDN